MLTIVTIKGTATGGIPVDWRADMKKTCKPLQRKIGMSAGLAGVMALGLTGVEAPVANAANQPRSETLAQPPALIIQGSTQIGLSLFEILGNVFQYIQVSTISDSEEVQIGQRINQMLLDQQYQLYNNDRVQSYVDRLGQRLVSESSSRDIPFKFQVVVSDEINAFAIPGGYVYVTTGLLRAAENEAQLASVLAHEIGHINERHSIEALKQATLAQGIAETANIEMSTLAQLGYQLAVNLPRSREFEYDADAEGLKILRQANYPTTAFINFLQKLEGSSATPEFLQTHPSSASRIRELRQQISAGSYSSNRGTGEQAYEEAIYPLN